MWLSDCGPTRTSEVEGKLAGSYTRWQCLAEPRHPGLPSTWKISTGKNTFAEMSLQTQYKNSIKYCAFWIWDKRMKFHPCWTQPKMGKFHKETGVRGLMSWWIRTGLLRVGGGVGDGLIQFFKVGSSSRSHKFNLFVEFCCINQNKASRLRLQDQPSRKTGSTRVAMRWGFNSTTERACMFPHSVMPQQTGTTFFRCREPFSCEHLTSTGSSLSSGWGGVWPRQRPFVLTAPRSAARPKTTISRHIPALHITTP